MEDADTRRFCQSCNREVHNLSGLTRNQAARLVISTNGQLCAHIRTDQNGEILLARPGKVWVTARFSWTLLDRSDEQST
jgi:hypothetical protein